MLKDGFPSLNVEFIDDATLQAAEYSVRACFIAEPCAQLGARDVRRVDVGAERTEDAQRQLRQGAGLRVAPERSMSIPPPYR